MARLIIETDNSEVLQAIKDVIEHSGAVEAVLSDNMDFDFEDAGQHIANLEFKKEGF